MKMCLACWEIGLPESSGTTVKKEVNDQPYGDGTTFWIRRVEDKRKNKILQLTNDLL